MARLSNLIASIYILQTVSTIFGNLNKLGDLTLSAGYGRDAVVFSNTPQQAEPG
jgi:hypothetical protein